MALAEITEQGQEQVAPEVRRHSNLQHAANFIVRGLDNTARSVVASRKAAMLRKRQTFYLDANEDGVPMIYEGRVVQARVIGVAEKVLRVEVFGVECTIFAISNPLIHGII